MLANLSKDKNKCSIFLDGIDGHCLNSYVYYKEEIEELLPRLNNETQLDYLKRYYNEVENGNKKLKAIRQKSKPNTFLLSYGGYPKKLSESAKIPLEQAQEIFDKYHNELYVDIKKLREKILSKVKNTGRLHLGLGYYLYSSNAEQDLRTLFNAYSQYWSILTLLTINKLYSLIDEKGYTDNIEIISSVYDSIYLHVDADPVLIKWVNDTIIPILTTDFLEDIIVHNQAEGELGFDWYNTIKISNNASFEEITETINKLKER